MLLQKKEAPSFEGTRLLSIEECVTPRMTRRAVYRKRFDFNTSGGAVAAVQSLLELEPSAARLTPSNLEDALAKFSDGDDLARLCSTAGEQAAQEEMKHRENDGESENSDDDEDLSFARTFVAAQVLDCARLWVDHKAIDEAGKVRVADAIDGDFVRTQNLCGVPRGAGGEVLSCGAGPGCWVHGGRRVAACRCGKCLEPRRDAASFSCGCATLSRT